MSTTATGYPHVEIWPDGKLVVAGTRFKLLVLVQVHLAYKWDALELHKQYPQLSLPQVYGALSYYYDHKAEVDRLIEESDRFVEQFRKEHGGGTRRSELEARLRARQSGG